MLKLRPSVLTLLIIFAATAPILAKDKPEDWKFAMPLGKDNQEEWKLASSDANRGGESIMEFVRKEDDISHWKELVTMQNLRKSHSIKSPDAMLEKLKALREKLCPGKTEWKVIDRKEDSILFEWHLKQCADQPDQSELARIIFGKQNVLFLHYAVKALEFPPAARAEWIKRFNQTEIIPAEK